ncbi:hypothetical protein BC940DRAFT_291533 [Gongronella butleri]|nr:hypothetical protein BC940DRAFT_291533 [Gongronella butleri]
MHSLGLLYLVFVPMLLAMPVRRDDQPQDQASGTTSMQQPKAQDGLVYRNPSPDSRPMDSNGMMFPPIQGQPMNGQLPSTPTGGNTGVQQEIMPRPDVTWDEFVNCLTKICKDDLDECIPQCLKPQKGKGASKGDKVDTTSDGNGDSSSQSDDKKDKNKDDNKDDQSYKKNKKHHSSGLLGGL